MGSSILPCAAAVREAVGRACGCDIWEFGGNQPRALLRDDLRRLLAESFLVTWKCDGSRILLAVLEFGTFILNRRGEVRCVGDALRGAPAAVRKRVCPLVADGEILVADGAVRIWLHDLIGVGGRSLRKKPLIFRLARLKKVTDRLGRSCATPAGNFFIQRKGWWPASEARSVMADPRNQPSDGLILWPTDAPYAWGRDDRLLKWKGTPTVDFWVTADYELQLVDGRPPDRGVLVNKDVKWCSAVVEAMWSTEPAGWFALFVRKDKPRANARDVYNNTLDIINRPVRKEDLLSACEAASDI
jgi:hypothetical protein